MSLKRKTRTLCARLSHGMGTIVSAAALAAILACSTQAQNEDTLGRWVTAPGDWDALDMFAMNAAHLPTGKVLVWGLNGNSARLWNPVTGDFTDVPTTLPIFCSGIVSLADGSILVAGGAAQGTASDGTAIFSLRPAPLLGPWQAVADMNFSRWYPTATTLPDGTVLTVAGSNFIAAGCPRCTPEIYDPVTDTWAVLDVEIHSIPRWYPFMFVAPDGRVFFGGGGRGGCGDEDQDCDCEPQQSPCGQYTFMLDVDLETWTAYPVGIGNNDSFFTATRGSAVMYEPGKVLKCGGGTPVPVNSTAVIDLNEDPPEWELVFPGMTQPRRNHNLVLLPDGTVLAVGGEREDPLPPFNIIAVYTAERFDPDPLDPHWDGLAAMNIDRRNHSTAVLLRDATVLAAGGGLSNSDSGEIFEPPYLFVAGGGAAPRPLIGLAPTAITYGTPFKVILSSGSPVGAADIEKVSLVRLASVTHNFDQNQRYVPLDFDLHAPLELEVQAPANANDAPPGYYMLFLVSFDGVPAEEAAYVQVILPPSP